MADNRLNNELLKNEEEKNASPKRNSKQELIQKIIHVAKENEITLELSDTKLQRMTSNSHNYLQKRWKKRCGTKWLDRWARDPGLPIP